MGCSWCYPRCPHPQCWPEEERVIGNVLSRQLPRVRDGCRVLSSRCRNSIKARKRYGRAGATEAVPVALLRHAEDPRVQEWGCAAAADLSKDHRVNARALCLAGAASAIVQSMKRHATDRKLQQRGCEAFLSMAATPELRERLGSAGACEVVAEALQWMQAERSLQRTALEAVAGLAAECPVNRRYLAEAGVCNTVASLLSWHPEDPALQEPAYSALANLAVSKENRAELGKQGACKWLGKALRKHQEELPMHRRCAAAAANLANDCPENRERLRKARVPEALCWSLQTYAEDWVLVELVLGAIAELAVDDAGREKLQEAGVERTILHAARLWPERAGVQERAAAAIANLACGTKDAIVTLAHAGACTHIVTMLFRHSHDAAAAERCCAGVANMCISRKCQQRMIEKDACKAVVQALLQHPDDAPMQRRGCAAMCDLAAGDPDVAAELGRCGGCEAAACALERHQQRIDVLERAMTAVVVLAAASQENRTRLGDAGACELIALALQYSPEANPLLDGLSKAAMCEVAAQNLENKKRFGAVGMCELVAQSLQWAGLEDKRQAMWGLTATAVLAAHCGENKIRLGAAGCCEALGAVLKSYASEDSNLAARGMIAVQSLGAECASNRALLREGGALEGTVFALRHLTTAADKGQHPSALNGLAHAVAAVAVLAADDETNQEALGARDVPEQVVQAFGDFPNDVEVSAAGGSLHSCFLSAIANLAGTPLMRRRLAAAGACECVSRAMGQSTDDLGLQERAWEAIAKLVCGNQDNGDRFGAAGCCEDLLATMQQHRNNPALLDRVCYAVAQLAAVSSAQQENAARLGRVGACDELATLLREYEGHPGLSQRILNAVANVAADRPENVKRFRNAGLIPVAQRLAMSEDRGVSASARLALEFLGVEVDPEDLGEDEEDEEDAEQEQEYAA
eukprot:TRINITY_DN16220_c0_g7_i1.p2 TRINITY_DN16220_c0_g7~~TRINITY_DN16220_c0_g7_i1.p2  ORF type:complete len:923 (+),score=311.43 TRINITY_DN16220_c0_g7_i1:70-2838(+)